MTDEQRVAERVRSFAAQLRPGDRQAAARGVAVALRALIAGASAADAYAEGRQAIRTWVQHPARQPAAGALDLAS